MSYQKCPICDGEGTFTEMVDAETVGTFFCGTCNGAKIIDEVTGLPPIGQIPKEQLNNPFIKEKFQRVVDIGNGQKIVSDELNQNPL